MINVTGVSESRVAPAAAYYANQKDQSIIIVSTDVRAKRLASDLSFFVQDKEIITLPEEEQFLLRYAAKNQDHMLTRLRACGRHRACFRCRQKNRAAQQLRKILVPTASWGRS